jgi:hypothetical protein
MGLIKVQDVLAAVWNEQVIRPRALPGCNDPMVFTFFITQHGSNKPHVWTMFKQMGRKPWRSVGR